MKFLKWQIEHKIKRLDADDRVIYLTEKLIDELKKSGREINTEAGDEHFDVWIFNHGEFSKLSVQNVLKNWSVEKVY